MVRRSRTDKSRYKHVTTGDYCTCAAYIAEVLCIRYSEFKNCGSLPFKFWNTKPWDWTFKKQLWLANSLLKSYPESVLVKAVLSPEGSKYFSLNHSGFQKVLEKYHDLYQKDILREEVSLDVVDNPTHLKKQYGKKSTLSRLKELENGKKKGK